MAAGRLGGERRRLAVDSCAWGLWVTARYRQVGGEWTCAVKEGDADGWKWNGEEASAGRVRQGISSQLLAAPVAWPGAGGTAWGGKGCPHSP